MENNKKVMLALSGGVDSSVCAELLRRDGFDVLAVVMKMSDAHEDTVNGAKAVAEKLSIPLTVLDLREEFKEKVITPFINDYKNARTPNPCIICNPLIKFKYLYETAEKFGCEYIATGHYAKVNFENGRYFIEKGESEARDQSYMLHRLPQHILSKLILPLGTLEKDSVRETAREIKLANAEAPDSQENCFIPSNDYAAYIEEHSGRVNEGFFISPEGQKIGKHKGIIHYTVGQRKGLGVALGKPVFVDRIDPVTNEIFLTYDGGQYRDEILVEDCVFMAVETLGEQIKATVKIRSAARCEKAVITPIDSRKVKVNFENPVKAPAAGQSAVFYLENRVLGGGFIV